MQSENTLSQYVLEDGDHIINWQSWSSDIAASINDVIANVGTFFWIGYKSCLNGQFTQEQTPALISVLLIGFLTVIIMHLKRDGSQRQAGAQATKECEAPLDSPYSWSVFDLAKTAYEPGHTEAVIKIVEKLHYNVNTAIPSNGLTLFLCACLSGKRDIIDYMISKGSDIHRTTKAGDTALYLATFGVLSSSSPDVRVLENLIKAGCDVSRANANGYTPLHRAAGHGDLRVIRILLKHGADPYRVSVSGIYPIDSATNAGNLEAAELLKINIPNPCVWDVIEPHTPPSIKLGLLSPQRKHLIESSRRITSPYII